MKRNDEGGRKRRKKGGEKRKRGRGLRRSGASRKSVSRGRSS